MEKILICTVGTAFKLNIFRESPELKEHYEKNELQQLVYKMVNNFPPSERILGAEINSIKSLVDKGYINKISRLIFLVSDTDDGEFIGGILKSYFNNNQNQVCHPDEIKVIRNTGLNHEKIEDFKKDGLKNLVKNIAGYVRDFGRQVIINATGGYKAQILFAGIIGQTLSVPVYYKHEKFDAIIELPPLPVSFDINFWLEYSNFFFDLADEDTSYQNDEISKFLNQPETTSLIETIKEGEQTLVTLTPMGQLFHEMFKIRFSQYKMEKLPADCGINPSGKVFKEESGAPKNRPPGIQNFVKKIFQKPYVSGARTFKYYRDLPKKNQFKTGKSDVSEIECIFSDGTATSQFIIITTAKKKSEQDVVLVDLKNTFIK